MRERHLASDTPVLIITVHSPGLLFHWHRETGPGASPATVSFHCHVELAQHDVAEFTRLHSMRREPTLLKLRFVRLQACFCFCERVPPLLSPQPE